MLVNSRYAAAEFCRAVVKEVTEQCDALRLQLESKDRLRYVQRCLTTIECQLNAGTYESAVTTAVMISAYMDGFTDAVT